MKRVPFIAVFATALWAANAYAQDVAGVDEAPMLKALYTAVSTGDWWVALSALLVLTVTLIRRYGRELHELIPDNHPVDKVFWFLLETRSGGWALNLLTSLAGGVGTTILAGERVTWGLVKSVLLVSVTSASLWEMVKDVQEFAQRRKAKEA